MERISDNNPLIFYKLLGIYIYFDSSDYFIMDLKMKLLVISY